VRSYKNLYALLRQSRWVLEEKQKELVKLRQHLEWLEHQRSLLQNELIQEQALANHKAWARLTFGAYAEGMVARIERLTHRIQLAQKAVDQAIEEILDLFKQKKQFELILKNKQNQDRFNEQKIEQAALDEVAAYIKQKEIMIDGIQ
jgi:flagellar export protein FliJ